MPAIVLVLALPLVTACSSAASAGRAAPEAVPVGAAATIVAVRHAETAGDDPRDPSLSEAGRARARVLLESVRDLGIEAVYTSQYRRTRDTGRIVAEGLNVPLVEVPITQPDIESYSRDLLERADREHPGGAVLVVGHSNTAPILVQVASAQSVDPIPETAYDRLYIVDRTGDEPSLVSRRYGAD